MPSDLPKVKFDNLAEELGKILGYDSNVLRGFISLLCLEEEAGELELARILNIPIRFASTLLSKMVEDGLVIKGKEKFIPVHPRLAISNLYRLAILKNENVRKERSRIDAITSFLIKLREGVQNW